MVPLPWWGVETLENGVRDADEQISNRKVGGLVNILNSHTIPFYSFEPPTAFDLSMRFFFLGDKIETNYFIFNIADSV